MSIPVPIYSLSAIKDIRIVIEFSIIDFSALPSIFCDDYIVEVKQGQLAGLLEKDVTGDYDFYSFRGIPYAKPPVGKLRFKVKQSKLIKKTPGREKDIISLTATDVCIQTHSDLEKISWVFFYFLVWSCYLSTCFMLTSSNKYHIVFFLRLLANKVIFTELN